MNNLVDKILAGADVREMICEDHVDDLELFGDCVVSASTDFQNKHNLINVRAVEKEGKFAVECKLSPRAYSDLINAIEQACDKAGFERAYSSSSNNGEFTVFFDKK